MAIRTEVTYQLFCDNSTEVVSKDGCKGYSPRFQSTQQLNLWTQDRKWVMLGVKHYCPYCAKLMEGKRTYV